MRKPNRIIIGWLVAGALLSFCLVVMAGRTAPGITYDSRNYLYAAESLQQKGILLGTDNTPLTAYAPVYPLILSLLRQLPFDFLQIIVFTQAALMAISVFFFGRICFPFFKNLLIFIAFYISIIFGSPLLLVFHFIWTEGWFISQSVWICWLLLHLSQKPHSFLVLFSIVVTGAFMCMTRYAGIFFMPGVAFSLWSVLKIKFSPVKSTWKVVLYLLLMELPLLLWWMRNKILYGNIMSDYSGRFFWTSTKSQVLQFLNVLTSWLLPDELPLVLRITLICGAIVFVAVKIPKHRSAEENLLSTFRIISLSLFGFYMIIALPICVYVDETIDDRILAPGYLFGIISVFLFIEKFHEILLQKKQKIFLILVYCWLLYPVARGIENVRFWNRVSKVALSKSGK
jgi:hypothetical protein